MVENLDERIQYGGQYGTILPRDEFWDDGLILKNDIMNYKIIKIKIYYNSQEEKKEEKKEEKEEGAPQKEEYIEEKYIVGICLVYKNLYNGEIKEIEHKGTDNILGMKEINIKGNEYLKRFNINIKDDFKRISQLSFSTNRNNEISVGIKDGEDKTEDLNEKDNVIIGCYGHHKENINALGCIYLSKKVYIEKHLIGFFHLRKILKSNEEFKEKWDKEYKKLDSEFQYMWRTVNLPDAAFAKIIEYCFL